MSESCSKVLLVDDDKNICELIKLYLDKENFESVLAYDGKIALSLFEKEQFDLVLLDVMLPGKNGFEICKDIRKKSDCPIIMLTAKDESFDKIKGLELGADDYIVKPFEMKEVMARIKAVLRRCKAKQADSAFSAKLQYDKLKIDLDKYELLIDDKKVDVPPKQMELLYFMLRNPNKVFSRNQLLDEVWGTEYFGDSRTVDVHIKRLREKLQNVSSEWELKTVWGVGYKFQTNISRYE